MAKKVVIIGAGIAGLSAGCYARMNGYDVEIHEAHHLPGGLCTAWKRQGYIRSTAASTGSRARPRAAACTTCGRSWAPSRAGAEEKERIAAGCLAEVERRCPGISSQVEVTDVATPHTFARYTSNWKGTYMTWILDGEFQRKHRYIPKTVPGLDGLYLASMWTNPPGGIPGPASVGREVVQILCHEDREGFVTTTP